MSTTVRNATLINERSYFWMKNVWENLDRYGELDWGVATRNAVSVANSAYKKRESLGEPTKIFPWTPPRFASACLEFHDMASPEFRWWAGGKSGEYWKQKVDHRYNTAILLASGVLPFNAEKESAIGNEHKILIIQNWIEGIWKGVHGFNPPVDGNFFRALAECAQDALKEIIEPIGGIKNIVIGGSTSTLDKLAEKIRKLSVERNVWGNDTHSFAKALYELPVGVDGHHKRENIMLIALAALNAEAEWEGRSKKAADKPPITGKEPERDPAHPVFLGSGI